ncbi:MAG: response regulator transcription factor [Gammaproteobacteria bacterium]|nr:response regulator transcription factor [Gammaproteobacteria bacterium]
MPQANIFIVDDHMLVRNGLRQLIEGEPDLSVCNEASSIAETLQLIGQTKPDLVIIDLSLPDGNGLKLIERLLARQPQLAILVSSMHDESLFAVRALKAGAKGYINKSATGDELLAAINQVLDGKKFISAQVTENLILNNDAEVSPRPEQSPVNQLSNRELEVFEFIGRGMGTGDIARTLNLSIKTIESHRANIKKKLGLITSGDLIRSAIQWSLDSNL